MSVKALHRAIHLVSKGNQTQFAKALSDITGEPVSQQIVNHWVKSGKGCAPRFACPIEELTDFKVSKEQLCPDFHWPKHRPFDSKRKASAA